MVACSEKGEGLFQIGPREVTVTITEFILAEKKLVDCDCHRKTVSKAKKAGVHSPDESADCTPAFLF